MNPFKDLYNLCSDGNISISTAESCTAGNFASNIAAFPGASSFFKGGIIAYQNNIKIQVLGVVESVLHQKTAVYSEVVEQMADGVRKKFSSDFSIATTGYAGPSGGSKINPIGTVFIAISSKERTLSKHFLFSGSRESIVSQAVNNGILFLIQELKNQK